MQRPYDIIVWGATGFTGQLCCEYLATNSDKKSIKFAIAGRNRAKLSEIREKILKENKDVEIGIIESDLSAIGSVVSQTKVLISLAGPFAKIGSPVIDACVKHGTSYLDITGEPQFVRNVIDKYHEDAKAKKIKIINCCGFDCIPCDLGVLSTIEFMEKKELKPSEIKFVPLDVRGGVSGGTIASLMNFIETATAQDFKDSSSPYYLQPKETSSPFAMIDKSVYLSNSDRMGFSFDALFDRWTMPYIMQSIDTRVVHRSNALSGWRYGKDFRYSETMAVGKNSFTGLVSAAIGTFLFGLGGVLVLFPPTRALLKMVLPKPGQGPDKKTRDSGYCKIGLWGKGRPAAGGADVTVFTGVKAMEGDCGYKETAKMICQAALCLLLDEEKIPKEYGVLTPSIALGRPLIDRLDAVGIHIFNTDSREELYRRLEL